MADISLIEVAHLVGSTKLSEMAKKVGFAFPPALGTSISVRELVRRVLQPPKPQISVSSSGSGQSSVFVITGSRFLPNHVVNIRVVDDALNTLNLQQSSDGQGNLNARFGIPCTSRLGLHFTATDGRPDPTNVLNQLESNTFDIPCP